MSLDIWLAFVVAASILLAIPGPTVLLVVSYALGHGRQSAAWTVPGVALGDFTALTLSLIGLGAVLSASSELFTVIKWAGAAYLIWLGIKMWRSDGAIEVRGGKRGDNGPAMLWNCFAITALNPKGLVFFAAFLPQFVSPAAPAAPQLVVLGATFLVLATANAALFAYLAGSAKSALADPSRMRLVNRIGGTLLIGAGALMASYQRAG